MATDTYTGQLGALENRISSLTSAVSQGYSGLPGVTDALRKSLFEREKTLPALEVENENKIKELYTADKRLAERYSTPGSEMFIENPMQRQALISGQKADIRGELGNILNLIQQRGQVMGSALDKGLEMYKAGLEAQKFELEQATQAWERTFKQQQANKPKGGSGKPSNQALAELMKMLTGAQNWQPSEEKPAGTPFNTEGLSEEELAGYKDVQWHSPQGQWQYNAASQEWLPTGKQGTPGFQANLNDLLTTYPELADTIFSNMDKITSGQYTKQTATEEYRDDLINARNMLAAGRDEDYVYNKVKSAYPEKSSKDIIGDLGLGDYIPPEER